MNNQIEQLAEEAGYQEGFRFSMEDFDMYKFTELIVKDCIDMCDEVDRINKYHIEKDFIDPELGPNDCIDVIKNHFGVK